MGSVGDCYDNAVCETFHASLKKERLYRHSWPTRAQARVAVFQYIEGWYNPRRRHSTLGYLSPIEFERHHAERAALTLNDPKSAKGSVASISQKPLDGLTTRRVSTVGVDLAAAGSISPENALVVSPAGSAQAASDAVEGRTVHRRPLRSAVKEKAR
jgi:Integrase core domain